MSLLNIENVSFNYNGQALLERVNLRLLPKEHVVLLGPNGTGKTTMMKLLMHKISPDKGTITYHPQKVFKALDQHLELPKEKTVIEYLSGVYQEFFDLEARMKTLYEEAVTLEGDAQLKKINQASRISERLLDSPFYQYQSEILKILTGLGLDESVLSKPLKNLSGGMRSKVKLTEILLANADVLLLDEPTNFLDENQVDWLLKYLKKWPNAFVLITHEERVAKAVAETIWAIEQKTIEHYRGDFSFYLKEKAQRAITHQKAFTSQQKLIEKTETFIAKNISRAKTTKRAQSRRKMLAKLERITPKEKERKYAFTFPESAPTGEKVCVLKSLEIGYQEPLTEPLDIVIRKQEKWVITGENGIGKTTLVKTILSEIEPINGNVSWIDTAKINYFSQDHHLNLSLTPFQAIHEAFPNYDKEQIFYLLGRFGLKMDKVNRTLSTLSGGEQSKVRLARLFPIKSNVFILDEPTNHLDKAIKNALKEALIAYQGTLILVSHERDFYEEICDIELHLEGI